MQTNIAASCKNDITASQTSFKSTIHCVMSLIEGLILLKQQLRPAADHETHVFEALFGVYTR